MKGVKIYLIIVSLLLIIALGFGIYIWYTLQTLGAASSPATTTEVVEPVLSESVADVSTKTTGHGAVVVPVDTLPESQQNILKTAGFKSDTLVVTKEMLLCGESALGTVAFNEISSGRNPTPLESLNLLGCLSAE